MRVVDDGGMGEEESANGLQQMRIARSSACAQLGKGGVDELAYVCRGELDETFVVPRIDRDTLDTPWDESLERLLEEALLSEGGQASYSDGDLLGRGERLLARPALIGDGDGDPALAELVTVHGKSRLGRCLSSESLVGHDARALAKTTSLTSSSNSMKAAPRVCPAASMVILMSLMVPN